MLIESTTAGKRGTVVTPPAGSDLRGSVGLMPLADGTWVAIRSISEPTLTYAGREAAADARLMSIVANPSVPGGRLLRQWRDAVASFTEESFVDWHIPGPRTSLWCCKFIDRRQGGPLDLFRFWKSTLGLSAEDYGVGDYEASMRAVYTLARWDCLDLPNLAGAEQIFRKCQMYEYVYVMDRDPHHAAPSGGDGGDEGSDKKKKGRGRGRGGGRHSWLSFGFIDEGAVFTGLSRDHGESMICPLLLEHVAKEVERDASVLKQVRKAREEQRALRS